MSKRLVTIDQQPVYRKPVFSSHESIALNDIDWQIIESDTGAKAAYLKLKALDTYKDSKGLQSSKGYYIYRISNTYYRTESVLLEKVKHCVRARLNKTQIGCLLKSPNEYFFFWFKGDKA
jgi:hypothetical protein